MLKPIAYDTETSGLLSNQNAYMFTYATCDSAGKTLVSKQWPDRPRNAGPKAQRRLEWIWSDENKRLPKIMHNAKFDIGMTERHLGRSLKGHAIHETMALSHLFQNLHPTHKLADLGWELFGYPRDKDDITHRYLTDERGLLDCPEYLLRPYQRKDVERTMLIYQLFYPRLKEMGCKDEYKMECELTRTTLALENRGMMIHIGRCHELIDEYHAKEEKALADFRAETGDYAKPTDSVLRHLLYTTLKLPVLKRTKNAKMPSVDADTLKQLEEKTHHPIFDIVLRVRSYHSGVASIEGYIRHADADGVIHPSIKAFGCDTGRESCSEPNLQNVQKDTTLKVRHPIRARRAFRPRPGYVNFHLDYSGIEARLAVEASGDPDLITMMQEDEDMHAAAAAIFYKDRWDRAQSDPKKRKALRDAAKNGNFCIMYGGGPDKLAACLGLSLRIAAVRYREYKERWPAFATLNHRVAQEVRDNGYVTTSTFNRRLYVPHSTPYAGLNYLIQGKAASVLKRSQNRVHDYLEDATGGEAGIILPIHDEIIVEWPRKRLKESPACLREMRNLMIDFPEFAVPMNVECKMSTADWSRPTKIKIPA